MTTQSNFPIPADFQGFVLWDKMHCPRPVTAMTEDVFCLTGITKGFTAAMDEFASPLGLAYQVFNTYAYAGFVPLDPGAEGMEARIERYKKTLGDVLPRMGELWANEWLPSIRPQVDEAIKRDYKSLSDDALVETFDKMVVEFTERYVAHGKINYVGVSASWFADFYNETFSPDDPTEAYQVLQGFPTRSLDAGRGLWKLSRAINNTATLNKLFDESDTKDLIGLLEGSDEGKAWLKDFNAYLDEFGWRSDVFEFADRTWRENPIIPLNTLQGYMRIGEDGNPETKYLAAVKLREQLLAKAREKLAGDPAKLAEFNHHYDGAKHYLTITEDHNYYIDQRGNAVMRLPMLELGSRLAAKGSIADANDVFHLNREDVKSGLKGTDHKALVASRKADLAEWAKIVPPPTIGEMPDAPPDPFVEFINKMFGVPPEPSLDPDVIKGIGASAGTVQGTVKVVHDLTEASKLTPGDIMVCEMTMPPWTPLFSIAAAVVADTGGVLSHCAIVSREYGMPCVVATLIGTNALKDGMTVTVDGAQGVVRIDKR
jgi:pyruvate,water dikinase